MVPVALCWGAMQSQSQLLWGGQAAGSHRYTLHDPLEPPYVWSCSEAVAAEVGAR